MLIGETNDSKDFGRSRLVRVSNLLPISGESDATAHTDPAAAPHEDPDAAAKITLREKAAAKAHEKAAAKAPEKAEAKAPEKAEAKAPEKAAAKAQPGNLSADEIADLPKCRTYPRRQDSHLCRCLPGFRQNRVWGSGPYTADSNICTAALHAGVITPRGGPVVALGAPGQDKYTSSQQNGVNTMKWGSYSSSFFVQSAQLSTQNDPAERPATPLPVKQSEEAKAKAGEQATTSLLGTELGLEAIMQSSASATVKRIGLLSTATVSEIEVEIPNVGLLDTNQPGVRLISTTIDVGRNHVDIDFDNAGAGRFARAYENTYIFRFKSKVPVNITGAKIDTSVTTLDLADEDISFSGNELRINVEGLRYNASSFARIILTTQGAASACSNCGIAQ